MDTKKMKIKVLTNSSPSGNQTKFINSFEILEYYEYRNKR